MIENIRKYTGLMIVVLVLLFVGLVFLGDNIGNTFSGKPVMEIADHPISQKEFQRKAIDVQKIAMEIPNGQPLPRETRILASHYLDEDLIENPYVVPGAILQQMGMYLQPGDRLPERFLANRIAVQNAGLEYGVTPSDDEVESFVENVLFADADGNFDQEASRQFFDEKAGKLGIGTRGFNEYVRDLMTAQLLSKVIGGGISPEMETVRALYDSSKQSITVQQLSIDALTLEAEVNPTEEEIKAFYEENKSKYNSDEKRQVSYIFVEPDWEAALAAATLKREEAAKAAEEARLKLEADKKLAEEAALRANENKDGTETPVTPPAETPAPTGTPVTPPTEEGPQGQTGEEGEPAPVVTEEPAEVPAPIVTEEPAVVTEDAPTPEPAAEPAPAVITPVDAPVVTPTAPAPTIAQLPQDKLNGVEKKEAVDALNPDLTAFYDDVVAKFGSQYEQNVIDHGYKLIQSELFTRAEPPALMEKAISNSAIGTIADAVFKLPLEGDPDEKITAPYQTADGWFVGRLDAAVASVPLTFEEAKINATVDLKKKLARELMIKRANELHETLTAAVKEGKSFEEAAKEAGHTITTLPDLKAGMSYQGQQFPSPPAFEAAQYTNPGTIAPVKFTPSEEAADRALIVFVEKREITKTDPNDDYATGLESAFKGQTNITRYMAFQNWLYDQYILNDVKLFASE